MSTQPVPLGNPGPGTVADAVRRYLAHGEATGLWCPESLAQRRHNFGLFVEALGARRVADCKPFHLTDWIESLPRVKSTATKKARANQVNACFNWAAEQGRIDKNPFRPVRYAEAEPRPPLPDPTFEDIAQMANKRFERAVGWFKWCRALATRYGKLAVNYVALWIIANIQYLLRTYPEALGVRLSDTT